MAFGWTTAFDGVLALSGPGAEVLERTRMEERVLRRRTPTALDAPATRPIVRTPRRTWTTEECTASSTLLRVVFPASSICVPALVYLCISTLYVDVVRPRRILSPHPTGPAAISYDAPHSSLDSSPSTPTAYTALGRFYGRRLEFHRLRYLGPCRRPSFLSTPSRRLAALS
ncbi:hypothetical protein B0H17DRAFT_1213346 [Mycena rosella]|uniref:Uncharacterized protein n=1 Tax=Mycena rosella TaxID=1033263 RepID=A0AAD7CQF2_MYCRO|nr:hypothetical protein B0H17DRAFT_1213346 [Mycena rosella]